MSPKKGAATRNVLSFDLTYFRNFSESTMEEKKLKSGKLSRAFQLGKTVTKMGVGLAKDKLSGQKNLTQTQIKAAKEMIQTMGELKGGLMKVGQMISVTGESVFPEEVTRLFATLQSSSSFMPESELLGVFETEFSKKPEEIFKSFERKPFAAASIGQVHKAVLPTGQSVAVKVQYPKIVNAIEGDLENLDRIEKLFDILGVPKPQMEGVLSELKRSLLEECDYIKEREAMKSIRADLEHHFPEIHIPEVFEEFCTSKILTTEFVSGDRFEKTLDYSQTQRDELGELLYQSYLYSLFDRRHLHTDPQNGNYLFTPEKVFLFDFGSTRAFSKEFVEDYALLQYAVERKDSALYRRVGGELGIIQPGDSDTFVYDHMMLVDKIYGPYLQEGKYFAKTPNPFGLVKEFVLNMNFKGRPTPREEFLLLDRANVGLFTKLQAWQSRVNWREGMLRYRQASLDAAMERYKI